MPEKAIQSNWQLLKNFNKTITARKKLVPKVNEKLIKTQLDVITFTIDFHNYRFCDKLLIGSVSSGKILSTKRLKVKRLSVSWIGSASAHLRCDVGFLQNGKLQDFMGIIIPHTCLQRSQM